MSSQIAAPGLPSDWLNGWLAAIGVTVLLPHVRLSWSAEPAPTALFHASHSADLAEEVAAALPNQTALSDSPIARTLGIASHAFTRNVTLDAYSERAALERRIHTGHLWSSVSDLRADCDPANLDHGAFDPPAPRGETLWSRAAACVAKLPPAEERAQWVADTFGGLGNRAKLNGLGFDPRRFPSGVSAARTVTVDPIVELLAFAALPLFPVRGDGSQIRQRGWLDASSRPGSFTWIAWRPPLDRWAIDAIVDGPQIDGDDFVIARYDVVPYRPGGQSDVTRAYFSVRVE